ncbi:tyrosine-type recombinase/integrase [Geodermatophilus sp. YIM 151500]|uniref:tyrosine-type recombinase/integrase n=1 Tax=Geodermatophilus sp. YIM 151500 TaxID=2984531 RepID=UPI00398CD501
MARDDRRQALRVTRVAAPGEPPGLAEVDRHLERLVLVEAAGDQRILHMIINTAVDDGRLVRNPASRVKHPRPARREKRFLTHPEVAALAEAAGPDRLVILVLAYCGLRFGELAALRVRNVDPPRRRLNIEESVTEVDGVMVFGTPKSHQCRSVPVSRSLVDAMAAACTGKAPTDLVFAAPRGGVLMLRNWRSRVFDPALQTAGLGELTPHEIRHIAASLAVAAGANVKAVQRMLGHASAAMTLDVSRASSTTTSTPSPTGWTPPPRPPAKIMRTIGGRTAPSLPSSNRPKRHNRSSDGWS